MFEAKLKCSKWRKIFETVKTVNNLVMFHCDGDGIHLRCSNYDNRSFIQLNLIADGFNEYEFEMDDADLIFGIDLNRIISFMRKAGRNDYVSLSKNNDNNDLICLTIYSKDKIIRNHILSDEYDTGFLSIPNTSDVKITMSSLKLNKICYDFKRDEDIVIKVFCESRNNISFSQITNDGIDKIKTLFHQSTDNINKDIYIKFNKKVDSKFLLSDLLPFSTKLTSISSKIDLNFYSDESLRIKSELTNNVFDDFMDDSTVDLGNLIFCLSSTAPGNLYFY